MRTAVVLLTRDLRVHDNPALTAAAQAAERVIPLFCLDERLLAESPNRAAFLIESLADLRGRIPLVVRWGDPAAEVARLGADAVFLSEDVSAYARVREERLGGHAFPGTTIVPVGEVKPYVVFTAYWNVWRALPRRAVLPPVELRPHGIDLGDLPAPPPGRSPELPEGGEAAGRARLAAWDSSGYGEGHDDLAGDRTSRLSPYLHFGCVSPLEAAERHPVEPFVRQLCWRDFFAQLLLHHPRTPREDLRPRGDTWPGSGDALAAWKEGRTGYPLVDAGMRQLAREGWMHNRARLVVGSFLTKHLGVDWRHGAAHFSRLLVDGDLASNVGNWQWIAGTGADSRPNRVLNPTLQARRHDPDGDYVRRYVPELAHVEGAAVHEPGLLAPGYPAPIVGHAEAVAAFRARRAQSSVSARAKTP